MTVPSIVMRGWLGWGNDRSPLDTYGPGGRWHKSGPNDVGDVLADALRREGADEGMHLVVIAVNRHFDLDQLAEIEDAAASILGVEPIRTVHKSDYIANNKEKQQ